MHITHRLLATGLLGIAPILSLACGDRAGPSEPATGAVEIKVSTESAVTDIDPDGYTLSIDGGPGQPVGVSASVTIDALPSGRHLVSLEDLAPNCSVSGPNPFTIDVSGGKAAAPVTIRVVCLGAESGLGSWDY